MKGPFLLLSISLALFVASCSSSKTIQTGEGDQIKPLIESKHYVFQAQMAQPSRGTSRQLTGGYELRVLGDTLIAQLPYFGRAYQAPADLRGGGIEFTSTNYAYTVAPQKKGRWNITFAPRDKRDVREMNLSVSDDGYANLQVLSNNREPISFSGIVVELKNRR